MEDRAKKGILTNRPNLIRKFHDIVQARWDTVSGTLYENKLPVKLISLFFSFLYDEKKDWLGIVKSKNFKQYSNKESLTRVKLESVASKSPIQGNKGKKSVKQGRK